MSNVVEMLDLVDENDNVIKTMSRDDIYAQGLEYVRVIEVFIRNSEGKLWIPTRLDTKRIAPGGYDVGVGGHIEHGESALDAFRKELSEEAGWNIEDMKWREVGKFGPNDGLNTVSTIFEISSDVAPELSLDDFKSAEWLSPDDIVDSVKNGHPAKLNLVPLIQIVYGAQHKNG